MPRLIVWIPPDKAEQLKALAQRERRDVRDQAAYLIERSLARQSKPPATIEVKQ